KLLGAAEEPGIVAVDPMTNPKFCWSEELTERAVEIGVVEKRRYRKDVHEFDFAEDNAAWQVREGAVALFRQMPSNVGMVGYFNAVISEVTGGVDKEQAAMRRGPGARLENLQTMHNKTRIRLLNRDGLHVVLLVQEQGMNCAGSSGSSSSQSR